ncbi:MAG TPA: patatin-like phospholipase family protein [Noviherbaspirillum sp.]|uniref:patatin-like phospholipase family protein n=1 Tax=Noviherbaspirillum sp. TaxID=1926288 RepID=UPI002B4882BA|nr:patatin-like phospholipase family protein [Noviherbaspirillum sp.]HJV85665.1 patatin-like phospholipase family protein [Noviherbaspirillum sp.]
MTAKRTSRTLSPHPAPRRGPTRPAPRVGLALAGGGPLGAVYEIGALAALEESIEGLDLNDAAIYVGISAGGIVAAGLANGITPHEMCRLFVESDTRHGDEELFKPEILLRPAWEEFGIRVAAFPILLISGLYHYLRRGGKSSIANSLERIKSALPTGILSGEGIHEFMQKAFSVKGRTNDFRKLKHRLVIVATDLDSGEPIRFGHPDFDHVPISKAAQASAAVPGLFPPVEIDGRYFVDGALRKTLHASIALDEEVDLVLCLNPIVPYNARSLHPAGKVAQGGLLSVLSQSLRAIIHSRVEIGLANYSVKYPGSDILLIEPSTEDADMFFTNLFSYTSRRRMCENAYQNTRMMLWQRRTQIGPMLERHGLRLKLSVLRDTSLTLVKKPTNEKEDRFGINRLTDTLDSLERHLKIVAG